MALDSDLQKQTLRRGRRRKRIAAAILLPILLLGGVLLVSDRFRQRSDLYDPVRAALVEADLHLKESYVYEQDILAQLQNAHRELESAIAYLQEAENANPEDRQALDALQTRLKSLEDAEQTEGLSPAELHRTYRALTDELGARVRKHQKHR
jgi:septal ring factor EnvC (AmiA/AmiB activator)